MKPLLALVGAALCGSPLVSTSARAAEDEAPAEEVAPAEAAAPATSGAAFQRVEERTPRAGTPLIANKLYPMQNRLEFTGAFDLSYADKYVEHLGGHASIGYHIFDWLAVEAFGGYLVGDETGIVQNVRLDGKSQGLLGANQACANPTCEPQLPDMYMTTWMAGADVQWAPIYGKLSAVSEVDLNFQLYLRGGAGAEGIQRRLNDNSFQTPADSVRVSGNYGIGLRLIPWKWMAVRAELVNYTGVNPNVEEHDSTDEGNCSDGYTLISGSSKTCNRDFSNNSMVQLGVSFLL